MVLAHVVPNGGYPVGGVTSLDNELFVVRETALQRIEVYDSTTFALTRNLPVNNLHYASGLTSCAVNKCLYVSHYNNNSLHRVDLSNSSATFWGVGAYPAGLSVNSANNVLVTCYQGNCVQEYTTQGTMIRQISFQSGISNPWWVIQIANDQFAVSSLHRVCIVDDKGVVTQSYGNPSVAGSALGQLNTPFGLIRVRNGSFLVADSGNNRLILLSPTLDRTLAVSLPIDGGLQCPRALCFNESRGRLFVGEYNGRRVLIFDDVYCNEF